MTVYSDFKKSIVATLDMLAESGQLPEAMDYKNITVEAPRDPSHGDMATNVAMVLSRQARMKPRDLAEILAPELENLTGVEAAEIAGPGFINLRLGAAFWQAQVKTILSQGTLYGSSDMGAGVSVNVEFVSANPTGPMHVGHVRGAVYGDALAGLLAKAGYDVCREYYINDAGSQIDVLAKSLYLRYQEAFGREIGEIPEGLYPGEYLIAAAEKLKEKVGDRLLDQPESDWLASVRDFAVDAMMDMIRDDLLALGIRHDVFFSEKTLHGSGRIGETVGVLRARGHIYEGQLEAPKGKQPEDWEARTQTLFRATDFGDEVDRPLQKSNGDYTYFGADIAYHLDKYARGFKSQINVWGADHGGYVKRVQAALKAMTDDAVLDVKLCQLVRLFRNGDPVKMSKRSGNFVTLREVVDEVGRDVTRFIMLTRKNDAPLDFDFAKVMEQSKDNPVFYVQYAHARICSVLRKAVAEKAVKRADDAFLMAADLTLLTDEAELAVIRRLSQWGRIVESAAEAHEPHRISFYLYDLASEFHSFWNKGNDNPGLRFIVEGNPDQTQARLALIRSVALVIASGLDVLGVEPVEEM